VVAAYAPHFGGAKVEAQVCPRAPRSARFLFAPPSRSNMRDTTPKPGRLTRLRRCCWIQEGDWVLITGVRK